MDVATLSHGKGTQIYPTPTSSPPRKCKQLALGGGPIRYPPPQSRSWQPNHCVNLSQDDTAVNHQILASCSNGLVGRRDGWGLKRNRTFLCISPTSSTISRVGRRMWKWELGRSEWCRNAISSRTFQTPTTKGEWNISLGKDVEGYRAKMIKWSYVRGVLLRSEELSRLSWSPSALAHWDFTNLN